MVRRLFITLLAASALPFSPLCQGALAEESRVIDGIAAIVNGDVITYSQVRGVSLPRERLLMSEFRGEELAKQIKAARDAALKDLIDRQLIVQSFKEETFELPDHFVDQRADDIIRESFGGQRQASIKTLQAKHYSLTEFKQHERE